MTTPAHVMILGCGRSGTSIFGELFEHLPAYTYYSEPPFAILSQLNYAQPIAVKVPKESDSFLPDPGLSFPLVSMLKTIPEPRHFFWQVRHPLDAISSLKVGISRDWGHHPQPPDWQEWLDRPLVERCAHHWHYINTVGFEQVAGLVTITRFEDMLADPLQFAHKIAQTIGLNIVEDAPLRAWAARVQDKNTAQFVEAETSKAYSTHDHTVKVGRWQENLSEKEVARVLPMIREAAQRFDYHL